VNGYIWAVCFGLLITYINMAKVGTFGEIEFWLALIKILALFGFVGISFDLEGDPETIFANIFTDIF
ncbi:MAG: hypothetical protein WCL60_01230, partial [Methylococcales bacterium]